MERGVRGVGGGVEGSRGREQEAGGGGREGRPLPQARLLQHHLHLGPGAEGAGGHCVKSGGSQLSTPTSQLVLRPLGSGGVSSPHSTPERITTVQK